MPRGDEYRAGFSELLKRKRVIPRDAEGVPTLIAGQDRDAPGFQLREVVRKFHPELGSQEAFVGLAIRGSKMRGYEQDSDIDLEIFYDSSLDAGAGKKIKKIFDSEERLLRTKNQLLPEVDSSYFDINVGNIRRYLDEIGSHDPSDKFCRAMMDLCDVAVGPKIGEYRKLIGFEIDHLPLGRCRAIVNAIADSAVRHELANERKMVERIPDLKKLDATGAEAVIQARIALWKRTIVRKFNLENAA